MRFVHSASPRRFGIPWISLVAVMGCSDTAAVPPVKDAGPDAQATTPDAQVASATSGTPSASAAPSLTEAGAPSATVTSAATATTHAPPDASQSVEVDANTSEPDASPDAEASVMSVEDAGDAALKLEDAGDPAEAGDTAPPVVNDCFSRFPEPMLLAPPDAGACESTPMDAGVDSGTQRDASLSDASPAGDAGAQCYPSCVTDLEARCGTAGACQQRWDGYDFDVCWETTGTRVAFSVVPQVVSRGEVYKADGSLCYRVESTLDGFNLATTTWYDACGQVVAIGTYYSAYLLEVTCQGETESITVETYDNEACWKYTEGVPNTAGCYY